MLTTASSDPHLSLSPPGVFALWGGLEPTLYRHIFWNAGYFGSIFQIKALLPKPTNKSEEMRTNLISGMAGGFIGTVLNTPADVVKTRIQSASRVPGQVPKYNWAFPSMALMFREEGFAALYKGFVPKVCRLAPGGGVMLVVVEIVLEQFRNFLGPPYK